MGTDIYGGIEFRHPHAGTDYYDAWGRRHTGRTSSP